MHNQLHIVNAPNGHLNSTDCWCEPVEIIRQRNKHGIDVLVVCHNDYTAYHHLDVLAERNAHRDFPCDDKTAHMIINDSHNAPWITRFLNRFGNPPLLGPASEPHERSI